MIDRDTIHDAAGLIDGIELDRVDLQQTIVHAEIQEFLGRIGRRIGCEPACFANPGCIGARAAISEIDNSTILSSITKIVLDRAGPLVIVIVSIEDHVHAIGFEDRDQNGLHVRIAAAIPGAVSRLMQKDNFPGPSRIMKVIC
jgi:hypothetical protein